MRLVEKTPVPEAPGRPTHLRRRWDTAQTPYQRLLATGMLSAAERQRLQALYEHTNPLALRQRIYDQLAALRTLAHHTEVGAAAAAPTSVA